MSEQDNPATSHSTAPAAGRPAAAPAAAAKATEKPKMVRVVNRLAQTVRFTVDAGNGPQQIPVDGRATSDPIDEKHLTDYTKGLVNKGHLALRSAE